MSAAASRCLNISDLQVQAKRHLPRVIYDYLEGGADDEACLQHNQARLHAHRLRPRYLVDISARSQQVTVFGQTYASPMGIGPMGMLGMVRDDGDLVLAEAAYAAQMPFVLSGASNASIERIAERAPASWLQYYPCENGDIESDLLARAAAAGLRTLVVTVDVPLHSKRERNIRSGWVRPYKPTLAVMVESLRHPAWVASYLRRGLPAMENFARYAPAGTGARALTAFYASQVPTRHGWPLIQRLRERWPGQLVVKGLLAVEDAEQAADLGVDGLIVSNHGGRQLDRSIAAIDALPEIAAAVGGRLVVMFDSGIRRGADAAVALALGARLCFVGRAAAYGLAAFGAAGARRSLEILRSELDQTLGQIGCVEIGQLDASWLRTARS